MNKITARKGTRFSDADARKIEKILKANFPHGELTPPQVLAFARPKSSPIHEYFDWDDSEAAESWRFHQARQLITCIVVEIRGTQYRKYTAPVYIEETKKRSYVEINVARSSPEIWEQVLQRALNELELWKAKYEHLKELKPIMKAIDKELKNAKKK